MKLVILLALVAFAAAQLGGIEQDVRDFVRGLPDGLTIGQCVERCDRHFDGRGEVLTDRLCREECDAQYGQRPGPGRN